MSMLAALLLSPLKAAIAENGSSVVLDVHYECLWWSPAQMVGLDPNHPPAKTTATSIARWEYSDPVGVPHPDVVDLVARVRQQEARPLSFKVRWFYGSHWSRPAADVLGKPLVVTHLGPSYRVVIPVKQMIEDRHAKSLETTVYLNGTRVRTLRLPIEQGD
jgi:hypothetical protein